MFSSYQPYIIQIADNRQIVEQLTKLDTLNYDEMYELFDVLCDFQKYYCKSMNPFIYNGYIPYDSDIDKVVALFYK